MQKIVNNVQGCTRRGTTLRVVARRGFTLIEVLIVIAILLAIGGLVWVNLMPAKEGADRSTQRLQLQQIDGAMNLFKLHLKRYPSEDEGLAALSRKDALAGEDDASLWQGPYLKDAIVKDAWNHELIYRFPGEVRGTENYDLISIGPDGEEGTEDDITNHDGRSSAEGAMADDDIAPPSESGG